MRLGLAAAMMWLAAGLAGCARPAPLPVLGEVPDFQLTAQSGQPFDRKSLAGCFWVADFIFTTCTGPCPRMSVQMRQVQSAVAGSADVKLVSFTVDPARDTPSVLADYARRYKAEPGRWSFLTGEPAALHHLARNVFKLHDVDGSLIHSTRFVLIDRRGRIRGYYASSDDDFFKRLMHDLHQLQREPA